MLRWVVHVFLVAIGLGLLGHVLWSNRTSFQEVMSHRPDFRFMALAVVLYVMGSVSTYLRWRILVRAQGIPLRVGEAIRVGFIANAIDQVIPGQIGGDMAKAAFLCRIHAKRRVRSPR